MTWLPIPMMTQFTDMCGNSKEGIYVKFPIHYSAVIMVAMASQITSLTIVYSTIYSGADKRKHQSSMSLAFVRGIHRWPVNSQPKGPVTRKMFPFDDVIMFQYCTIIVSTYGSGHRGAAVLNCIPGFAVILWQNQVTRQPQLSDPTHVSCYKQS